MITRITHTPSFCFKLAVFRIDVDLGNHRDHIQHKGNEAKHPPDEGYGAVGHFHNDEAHVPKQPHYLQDQPYLNTPLPHATSFLLSGNASKDSSSCAPTIPIEAPTNPFMKSTCLLKAVVVTLLDAMF